MQLIVPMASFFLEKRLKLADAGLTQIVDIHDRAGSATPAAQVNDSRFACGTAKGANGRYRWDTDCSGCRIDNDDAVLGSEEHTSELQSPCNLVCRLLLEKKKNKHISWTHCRNQSLRHAG